MELLSCLEKKDVINICSGARLGFITDVMIELKSGRICSVLISERKGFAGLFCDEKCFEIPWDCIKRIGDDTILVDIDVKKSGKDCC